MGYTGPFTCFTVHLTQDKNKEDPGRVRISKAPMPRESVGVELVFFFFPVNLNQTSYISQAAKRQKRSNAN